MADQELVAQNFDLGMQQDRGRDQLPRGAAWRMLNYIPEDGAPARKRGGWAFASADLNPLSAATRLVAVAWAPFSGGGHLIGVSDNGKLYRMGPGTAIDATAGAFVAAITPVPSSRPFWHKDRIIIPQGLGLAQSDPVKYYDSGGGTYVQAAVGGTPPRARMGWSYGDYLMLGNGYDPGTAYALRTNRVWNSNVGNPDGWNTAASGGFTDFPEEVVGGVYNRGLQLVFGYSKLWIINGTIPPPGGDFSIQTLYNVGCFDERSIALHREYTIWANAAGIWRTDGSTLTELTKEAGLSILWRSLVSGFNYSTGWKAAGGVMFGQYYCTITDNTGANIATFVIDLNTLVGTQHTNFKTMMYAPRISAQGTALEAGSDELFMAWYGGARAARLSGIWTPSSANRTDADGVAVLPSLETPYYKLGRTEEKRFRYGYLGYDLRNGGESPTLAVGYALSPELEAYTEQAYQFPAGTRFDRQRIDIRQKSEGVSLRIRQTAASSDTRLAEIELEGHPVEGSR